MTSYEYLGIRGLGHLGTSDYETVRRLMRFHGLDTVQIAKFLNTAGKTGGHHPSKWTEADVWNVLARDDPRGKQHDPLA